MNKIMIIGYVGKDPELKGEACNFTVATSEKWTDKDGKKQERTEWHAVVAFGKLGEICHKYISKGKQVFVEGKIRTNVVEGRDGGKKYFVNVIANEVTFLGKSDGESRSGNVEQDEEF